MPEDMKIENTPATVSLRKEPEGLEMRQTPFRALTKVFEKQIDADTTGKAYEIVRKIATGEEKPVPVANKLRLFSGKYTPTQDWAARLVQLAAQDIVLGKEGEGAFPTEKGFPMGMGTAIEPEASRILDRLGLFYDGRAGVIVDKQGKVMLDMVKEADNFVALKAAVVQGSKDLAVAGAASVLVLLLAGCADKGPQTPTTGASPTSPTATEVTPGVTETQLPPVTPSETQLPATATTEATIAPMTAEGLMSKEWARGEVMTPEQLKTMIDWYYNLSDEELNALTDGKLFSFTDFKGDFRPRDKDKNVLSQDVGSLLIIFDQPFSDGSSLEHHYFNGVELGVTISDSGGKEYYVSAVGMKDANGNRVVMYGVLNLVDGSFFSGAIINEGSYGRTVGSNIAGPVDGAIYIQGLLNNHVGDIVLVDTGRSVGYDGPESPSVKYLDKLQGDERFEAMIMDGYKGVVHDPAEMFDLPLGIGDHLVRSNYDASTFQNFARILLVAVAE